MAASYPTSVKSFSTKSTTDTVEAAHPNELQDEVTAIETDLLAAFPGGGADGGQFKFPATQNPSSDANTLDDYEEGTWTPAANGVTLTVTAARYTKIGRLVTVEADVTWPANADGNQARMSGLPVAAGQSGAAAVGYNGSGTAAIALIQNASIFFYAPTSGTTVTNANFTGAMIRVAGSYSV